MGTWASRVTILPILTIRTILTIMSGVLAHDVDVSDGVAHEAARKNLLQRMLRHGV